MEDFYIGEIFETVYPPEAATWCNTNNATIVQYDNGTYQIVEIPVPPQPTRDEIREMRILYRHEHIDNQTLERNRKTANGTWTQEDEEAYLALDAEVTAYIEENLPYPEEEGNEEEVARGEE